MKYVAYYRVSTQKQGRSGLGLEAQQEAVRVYCLQDGGHVIKVFIEVESGRGNVKRPELARAIAHAKMTRSTLLIAKLDRLSRNVHFISALMDSGVDFICCDNPTANRFALHILAAVAEHESKTISERTSAALQAAKRRGKKLGMANPATKRKVRASPNYDENKFREAGQVARREQARDHYRDLMPDIYELREMGASYQGVADYFNERGILNREGRLWNRVLVFNLLKNYPRTLSRQQ